MNLSWYYWYFQSVVPEKICDDIIEYGLSQKSQIAITGSGIAKEPPTKEELKNIYKRKENQT